MAFKKLIGWLVVCVDFDHFTFLLYHHGDEM